MRLEILLRQSQPSVLAWTVSLICVFSGIAAAQEKTSPKEEKKITFEEHIKPIFREHCTACHSESDKESDLALDTYGATLAGGSSGDVIAEGDASGSRLFALITHAERPYMPPDQDPIAKEQIALVKTWIEQGMPENSGSKIKRASAAASAMLSNVSIGKPDGPPPMPEKLLVQPVLETPRSAAVSAIAASPWAPLVALGGQEQVLLYHAESGELLGVIPFPEGEPQSLTFTRDGKQILIGGGRHSHSGCAVLVDVASGERITKVGDELDIVLAADISPDKSRIAVGGPSKIVKVFDSVSGDIVHEMKKHTDWIFTLRYSPDGVLLASGDRSNGLIVWEADTGNLYSQLNDHKGEIRSVDFRADSNVLASGSMDGTIKLWDMFESKAIKSWNAHGGGVTAVAFSHNGLIASAGKDARAKLWDGNGQLQKEFQGLSAAALEVAVTGDASAIAAGDWNGNVNLWPGADPAKSKLIVANPPRIETRMEQASQQMESLRGELQNAESVAQKATEAAKEIAARLAEQQKQSEQLSQQQTERTKYKEAVSSKITELDSKLAELESQLAALRSERTQATESLKKVDAELTTLATNSTTITHQLSETQKQHEALNASAQTATATLKQIQTQFAAAQSAYEKAAKEKAALDARAEEYRQLAQATQNRAQELATQLEAASATVDSQSQASAAAASQLQALQQELEQLQAKVAQALKNSTEAAEQLESQKQKNQALQQDLESAQQAALDAKSKLELFEQSYKAPQ